MREKSNQVGRAGACGQRYNNCGKYIERKPAGARHVRHADRRRGGAALRYVRSHPLVESVVQAHRGQTLARLAAVMHRWRWVDWRAHLVTRAEVRTHVDFDGLALVAVFGDFRAVGAALVEARRAWLID